MLKNLIETLWWITYVLAILLVLTKARLAALNVQPYGNLAEMPKGFPTNFIIK